MAVVGDSFLVAYGWQFILATLLGSGSCFCLGGILIAHLASLLNSQSTIIQRMDGILLICVAVVLLLVGIAIILRLNSPLSLDIDREGEPPDGKWILRLRRKGRPAIQRPVQDLHMYVETFGYCGKVDGTPWFRRMGFSTHGGGTVHLCFRRELGTANFVFSASLRDPRAFFAKLRDVMQEMSHPLAPTTAQYVTDGWASQAPTPRNQP